MDQRYCASYSSPNHYYTKNSLLASAAGTVVFSAHFMVCCLISCISYDCILLKKGHLNKNVIVRNWKSLAIQCSTNVPKDDIGLANSVGPDQTAPVGAV